MSKCTAVECIKNIYKAGLTNYILFFVVVWARLGIKNSNVMSDRMVIENCVMQGTVWADYKYRTNVFAPPLEMVDNVIFANKCGI